MKEQNVYLVVRVVNLQDKLVSIVKVELTKIQILLRFIYVMIVLERLRKSLYHTAKLRFSEVFHGIFCDYA